MATIGKTKTGKWCAQVRTHQKYISKTFISKAHASKWAKEVEYQLDREQFEDFSDSAKLSLGDILIRYRDEITPNKKSRETETYKINSMLRHKISKIRLLDLKTKHVLEFKKDIKDNDGKFYPRASSTINKYVHFIYTVWETAKVNWGITLPPLNPVSLVKAEKIKDKIDRILTPEEYQDLLLACSKSNLVFLQDMVEFAYLTAMRFGEITKLKSKNVNFEKSTALLLDTKNGDNRLVPLTDRAIEIAKKYRFQPRLFPVTRDKCRHYFEQALKRAEINKFRFHDLRACAITNLFLNGWYKERGICNLVSQKTSKKKVDPFEAKQQLCGKLGFPIGTQENGNCVLKILEIESGLKQKEESSGGQLTETDKLIRQQRLNQSLLLMQQGLNLMSPPQPKLNCRTTLMGWTCY